VEKLVDTRPSLVIILYHTGGESRWVLTARP